MRQPDLDPRSKPAEGRPPQPAPNISPDQQLDDRLRADLEPSEELVRRVTLRALSSRDPETARSVSWAPAWVWSFLLVLGFAGWWWLGPYPGPSPVGSTDPSIDSRSAEILLPDRGRSAGSSTGPILHLSNRDGFVTVSSAQGSRWVMLSNAVPSHGADGGVGPNVKPNQLDPSNPSGDDPKGRRREI